MNLHPFHKDCCDCGVREGGRVCDSISQSKWSGKAMAIEAFKCVLQTEKYQSCRDHFVIHAKSNDAVKA